MWPKLMPAATSAPPSIACGLPSVTADAILPFLQITRDTLQLNPDAGISVDVRAFSDLVASVNAHGHETPGPCIKSGLGSWGKRWRSISEVTSFQASASTASVRELAGPWSKRHHRQALWESLESAGSIPPGAEGIPGGAGFSPGSKSR